MSRRSSRRSRTPGGKTPLQIFEEEEDALDNQEGVISTSSDEEKPVKKKVKSGLKVKITGNNGKKSTKEQDNATPGPSPKQTKKPLSPEEMRKRRGEASALLKEQFDGEPSQSAPPQGGLDVNARTRARLRSEAVQLRTNMQNLEEDVLTGPMKFIGQGLALNMEATADSLECQDKMGSRFEKTEMLYKLLENEFGGSKQFDNDADLELFLSDREKKMHYGLFLAEDINWDIHWSKKIIEKMFSPNYIAEHKWPSEKLTKLNPGSKRPAADVPVVPSAAFDFIKGVMRASATAAKDTIYNEDVVLGKCSRQFTLARKARRDAQEAAKSGTMAAASKITIPDNVPDGVIWQDPNTQKKYVRIGGVRVVMVFENVEERERQITYEKELEEKKAQEKNHA